MTFITFTLLVSVLLATGAIAMGPYLYHKSTQQKSTNEESLIALVTSHLTTFIANNECTFLLWQNKDSSLSHNLLAQFSTHFTSVFAFANNSLIESSLPIPSTKFHEPCSVALYLNLDYFSGSMLFPRNWFYRLPGGFTTSYHLIFHRTISFSSSWGRSRTSTHSDYYTLTQLPGPLQRMIHRIFISIRLDNNDDKNGYQCDLWNCDIFGKRCARLEISQARDALSTKQVNFNGDSLIFAAPTLPQISQKALKDYIKYRKNIDVYITPYVEISEYFNATPTLNQISSQNFGILDKNGKWNGVAGEVVYGRAHISNGLVTYDRYEALFLSKTIDTDGLAFATGPPPRIAESPFFLIESYDWRIWLALLATILLMLIISSQIVRKYFDAPSKSLAKSRKEMEFSGVVMFIISPLLEQPADSKKYRNFVKVSESRWMLAPWLLSIVVVGTMFKTSLISTLTSPEVYNPPKDFKTLLAKGYHFNFLGATSTAGAVFNELKAKGNLLVNELDKRIVTYYNTSHGEDCISKTYGKQFACFGIGNLLLEFGTRYLTEDSGEALYRISREYLYSSYYSLCISKKLPHLLAAVDMMMYHYSESGSYLLFRKNIVRSAQKYGKLLAAKRRKERNDAHGTSNSIQSTTSYSHQHNELENTLRSIIVLGMGFGLATGVLIMELLFHHLSDFRIQFSVVRK